MTPVALNVQKSSPKNMTILLRKCHQLSALKQVGLRSLDDFNMVLIMIEAVIVVFCLLFSIQG